MGMPMQFQRAADDGQLRSTRVVAHPEGDVRDDQAGRHDVRVGPPVAPGDPHGKRDGPGVHRFEGYILLPDGINMRKSTVTNIRRWSLRDDAAGWDIAHENVAGFVTVQRYNEKGPIKTAA